MLACAVSVVRNGLRAEQARRVTTWYTEQTNRILNGLPQEPEPDFVRKWDERRARRK